MQKCRCCQQEQPENEFNARDKGVCVTCVRLKRGAIKKHVVDICKEADSIVTTAMQLLTNQLAETGAVLGEGVPNVGVVTEDMMTAFGGSRGFALQYAANYLAAEPGSATRQRILSDINRSVAKASELGYAQKPLELLSDEELEEYLEEKIRRSGANIVDVEAIS